MVAVPSLYKKRSDTVGERRLKSHQLFGNFSLSYDEPIANRSFETLDDLEEVLFYRCQSLFQQQDLIRGLTGFYWWTHIGA